MSRLRIIFIVSLIILGAMLASMVYLVPQGQRFTQVQREQLARVGDYWMLQLDIINHEGQQTNFTIDITIGQRHDTATASIPDGRMFRYNHYLNPEMDLADTVDFAVYREGESAPIEQGSYKLK